MSLSPILELLYTADFDNALEMVEEIRNEDKLYYALLKARILELKGKYTESLQHLDLILNDPSTIDPVLHFSALVERAYVHYRLRRAEETTIYTEKAKLVEPDIADKNELYRYFESTLCNLQGNLQLNQGYIDEALDLYQKSIDTKLDLRDKFGVSTILSNMGEVHRTRGNYREAERYFKESIEHSTDHVNQAYMAIPTFNLGLLHSQLGDYDLSLEYLSKTHNMTNYLRYPVFLAYILYQLVIVNMRMGRDAEAKGTYGDLTQLESQIDNDMIKLLAKTAQAIILKEGTRTKDKAQAQMLFEEIVNDPVIDHEITVLAQMNLCQLLLDELKQYGDEDVLKEINRYVVNLEEIALSQNSPRLKAETLLLQSKLALLELDLIKANRLLSDALVIANKEGYENLAIQLSNEIDNLLENERLWNELKNSDNTITERLNYVDFEEIVDNVKYRNITSFDSIQHEIPRLLMVIDQGGVVRYTLNLGETEGINENLIGAFLSAINSFLNDAFSTTSQIEFIKYGNYKIIMKAKDTIIFCYIFEGSSYYTTSKVEKIIELFENEQTLWEDITSPYDKLAIATEEFDIKLGELVKEN